MFEQAFRNIDDILRKEAGPTTTQSLATRKLAALEELKKALLHRAFAGEL